MVKIRCVMCALIEVAGGDRAIKLLESGDLGFLVARKLKNLEGLKTCNK